MKIYHLKITGGQIVDIKEPDFRGIEAEVMAKSDKMISAGGIIFSARDVRLVSSSWMPDGPPAGWEDVHPEITPEQRARNLKRMAALKAVRLLRPFSAIDTEQQKWYEDFKHVKETGEYPADDYRAKLGMNRQDYKDFTSEFFDLYSGGEGIDLETEHSIQRVCVTLWWAFKKGTYDPRDYDRNTVLNRAKRYILASKKPDALSEAKKVFGVAET